MDVLTNVDSQQLIVQDNATETLKNFREHLDKHSRDLNYLSDYIGKNSNYDCQKFLTAITGDTIKFNQISRYYFFVLKHCFSDLNPYIEQMSAEIQHYCNKNNFVIETELDSGELAILMLEILILGALNEEKKQQEDKYQEHLTYLKQRNNIVVKERFVERNSLIQAIPIKELCEYALKNQLDWVILKKLIVMFDVFGKNNIMLDEYEEIIKKIGLNVQFLIENDENNLLDIMDTLIKISCENIRLLLINNLGITNIVDRILDCIKTRASQQKSVKEYSNILDDFNSKYIMQ